MQALHVKISAAVQAHVFKLGKRQPVSARIGKRQQGSVLQRCVIRIAALGLYADVVGFEKLAFAAQVFNLL